jgi:predicted ATPase
LAHHYTASGDIGPAIDSWLAAGERATERSANAEAIAHLRRGLDLITELPEGVERARRELRLQIAIGTPLMALESYGSRDLKKATERARQLCEEVGDPVQLLPLLYRQTAYELVQGNLRIAIGLAEEFLRTAEKQDVDGPALVAHRIIGVIQYTRGELSQSRSALERMLELYVHERHAVLAYKYGQDPQPPALAVLSIVLHLLGYPDQASSMRDAAIAHADDIAHANTLGYAKTFAICVLGAVRRDWEVIRIYAPSILEFTEHERLRIWNLWTKYFHSLAMAQADPTETAITGLGEVRNQIDATGTLNNRTFHLALHAEILDASGQTDKAVGMIDEALNLVEAQDERWWQAEILRLKGSMTSEGKKATLTPMPSFRRRSRSPGAKVPSHWSCVLPPAWPGSGKTKVAAKMRANCSLQSIAGLRKDLTPLTFWRPRLYSTSLAHGTPTDQRCYFVGPRGGSRHFGEFSHSTPLLMQCSAPIQWRRNDAFWLQGD